ncbi:MAG: beta strand repeat-containing protein, partial [Verrucomicrobiaceae bacterium]
MSITGTNIPSGATVASITNSTTFELSVAASGTASGLRLGAVAPTRVAGLLTVGTNGTFTSTADNKLEGGLLVQAGGFVTALSGNNTFGLTPGGSVGATFNNTGTLALSGINAFNGPLNVGGNLVLGLGSALNVNSFKGEVNVSAGSVTVGGATTLAAGATTFGSTGVTVTSTAALMPGMVITGTNIAPGTTVLAVTSATAFTLSKPAIGTGTGLTPVAVFGTTFDKLVSVTNAGIWTANGGNTYAKGLSVDSTGVISSMTGNNTFGTVAGGTDAVTFNQSGTLALSGVNLFNGPLNVNGQLALTLGSALNVNSFKGGVNVTNGAVTVGGSTTLAAGVTTFGSSSVTVTSTAGLLPGMVITGTNIAPGTTVSTVDSATTFTLSKAAIGTGTALAPVAIAGTTFDKLVTVNGSGSFTANGGNTYTKGLTVESTGVIGGMSGNNIFGGVANGADGVIFRQGGTLTMAGVNLFNGPLLIDGPLGLTLGSALNSTTFKAPVTLTGGSLTVGGTTTLSCTFTTSSALITTTTNTSTILVGMVVTGAGIPAGATVTAVNSATTFTISATPTVPAATAITLTFLGVNNFDKALALNGYSTFTGNGANVFTEGVAVAPAASFNSSGNSTFGGAGLVFNNAGALTMAGTNVFTGPLTLNGALALSLTNTVIANTFTGPVTINEGSLAVSHATNTFAGLVTQSSPVSLTFSGTGGTQTFNNGLVVTDGVLTAATSAAVNITAGGLTISGPGGATFGTAGTANLAPVVINGDLNITGSGSSTFNGGVTVSGNTVLGNSRKLIFGGNNTFTGSVLFNNPIPITFTGTTSISGAVTMNRGVVTIPGATNSTAITLNGGSLTIGTKADGTSTIPITISGAGSLLSLTETVTASGSFNLPFGSLLLIAANKEFIFSNSASQTMDGLIGGGGAVTKNGAGALTLTGPMSFQGDFKVNGGSVTLTPSAAFPGLSSILPDRSSIILATGTSLNLNGFREKVGSVTGNGSVNLGANGSLLLGGNNSSGTLSGGISGSGFNELIKQGSGSLSLYGVGNFGGKVKIEGGTLEVANNDGLGNGNAIGDTTNVAISQAGSTFSVTTNETVGSVTGVFGSTVNLGAGATLTTSYTDASGGSLSAVLTSGSRLVGEIGGTGTRDLISSMFAANSSFIYDPSWIVQVIGTGQDDSPGLVLSASILSPGGTGTLNFTRVGLLASNLTGAGNFVKNGPGTLMLVGNNTNTGVTRINAGTFQLGGIEVSGRYVHQNILSDQSRLEFGTTGSQTVNLADNASNLLSFERVGSIGGGVGSSSVINLINGANDNEKSIGALVVGSDNTNSLFVGQINGTDALALDQPGRAFFMKEGDGTFTFRSTGGGFDGTTRVEAGTLAFPSGSNGLKGDRGNIVISNATNAVLSTVTQQSVLSLAGGAGTTGTFRNGVPGALLGNRLNQVGGEINITSEVSVVVSSNNGEHAFSGRITGVGGFAKADNHTAILMGANTYTGDTQINGGILQLGYLSRSAGVGAVRASDYVGSLSSSTLVSMTSGSLVLNSLNVGVRSLISTSQGSRIVLGNGTFTLNAADGEDYAGTIRTNGVGVATGFGLPHIGVVEVKSGTLNLMSRSSGDLLSTNLAGIDGPRLVIGNGGTVRLGNTAANNGGNLADTTRVTIAAGGTLSFRNENTSGEVIGSLSGAGTVDLGSGGRTLALTEAGGLSHGVFTGVITGTGNVLVNGQGSLILSGTNTYSGTTQLSAGASVTLKTGNTAGPSTILPDTTVLRLGQGTVRLQGVATETVASTTLDAGFSKVIRDFASTATLNLGAITVNSGGALQVTPGTVTTITPNLLSGILGGYALAGSASWAVKNSGSGLIEALDETAYSSFWAVGNHTNIDDDNLGGSIFQTNATTGTLRFGAPPSGEFRDIALIINQTATIANGGILMNRDFGQYNAAINPGITSPKLVSGTNHLYIHQFNELGTLTINASIQENTIPLHFVKTGPGKLVLAGNNLFSGSVTIAGGTLQAGNNSALSGNPLGVTSTPIANDGILALNVGPGPELAIFNVINGSGSIRQIGDGESALVEPNTYTGRTSVIAGVLSAQNPLALGSVVGLTAVSDGAKLVLSGDGGVTTTFERIALKGGTLDLTNGAVLGGQVITTVPSTINAPGGAVSLKGSVISPQYQAVTLNAVGNNGNISIYEPNYWGSVELGSGSVDLRGGDLGRGDVINNTTEGQGLTIDTGEAFRVLANNISGTGRMTQASGDLYLTGNNTFEGGISIGATSRAILHVGADSFSGTLGTGPVVIDSPTDNNSQLRFHRADTLLVTNSVTLNPNDNNGPTTPGGTTPRNADFVKEGAGNLVFLGALVAGPHGGANSGPNTQRALVTVNSGRLIFDGATLTNSTDSSLAINNNSHIEFRGNDTNAQTGTLFGAMGGGGTWVMNAGIIKLNNTGTTLGGWNGNVFIRQGELQTLAIDQLGNDLDVIINNGAALTVVADETVGNIFTQKGGVLESVINIRMDDGDEKIMSGFITGGGSLTLQNGTLNLYGTDSNFGGDLILVSGTARVLSLRNNGETSAAGSGDSIVFGEAGSTSSGALEYLGLGNSSSRGIVLAADDAGTAVNSTISSNGTGALILSGAVTRSAGTKTLTLAGSNLLGNTFSGSLQAGIGLIKSGTGTWRLTGNRPTYANEISAFGGLLEIADISVLGDMGAGTSRTFNLNNSGAFRFLNPTVETETFNSLKTFNLYGTGGFTNDGSSTLVFNGSILQPMGSTESTAGRNLVLDGSNATNNSINGTITGTVGGQSTNIGIVKNGSGKWIINNSANNLTGGTTINAGTLEINGGNALADVGTVSLTNGAVNGFSYANSRLNVLQSETVGALSGSIGTVVDIAAGQTLSMIANSGTFQGVIQGGGGLTVSSNANDSARVLTLSNINTFSGAVSILGGTQSDRSAANRIDFYYLANGGADSSLGRSSNAASNLTIDTKGKGGGLRFIGFSNQSTDRLMTIGTGNGATSGESAASFWADGQTSGKQVPTVSFTNTGAVVFTGSGNRKLSLRGGNRGDAYNDTTEAFVPYSSADYGFNRFSLSIGDGPGGATSIAKLEDSVWLLNGANSYTGAVLVERGTLAVGHDTALGTSAGGVTVSQASNDTISFLDLRGGITVTGETLTINGGANNTGNGWGASLGNNTWTGAVQNNGGNGTWGVLGATTSLTVSGVVSGALAISKVGNGTLVLSGANTNTAAFNAMGGKVVLDYSAQNNSKLADAAGLVFGGAAATAVQGGASRNATQVAMQAGTRLEVKGGTHVEAVSGTTLNAGASTISRAPADSGTSQINLAGITANAGGTLNIELPTTAVTNCTLRRGSTAVVCGSTANLVLGMVIYGPNIPSGATVFSIADATTFNLNVRATASATGVTLTRMGLTSATLTGGVTVNNSATITSTRDTSMSLGQIVVNNANLSPGASITSLTQRMTVTNSAVSTGAGAGVPMRAMPARVVMPGCATTAGSTAVTTATNVGNGLSAGMVISGPNIVPGTTVVSASASALVLSVAALGTGTGQVLNAYTPDVPLTGCTTDGTATVFCDSTAGLVPGMVVRGLNVPDGATVATVNSPVS